MNYLLRCWRAFGEMPLVVGQCCGAGAIVGPLMAAAVLLPIVPWRENGTPISYQELWSSGVGPVILTTSLLLSVGSWGAAARIRASRWGLVLWPVALNLGSLNSSQNSAFEYFGLALACAVSALIYFCLFHTRAAKEYFSRGGV